MTYTIWRTNLVANDRTRNWSYLWCRTSQKELAPITLVDASGKSFLAPEIAVGWPQKWWGKYFATSFMVPGDCPAGEYAVVANGLDTGKRVRVGALPSPRGSETLRPMGFDDAANIQDALRYGDVLLTPGLYYLKEPIRPPANRVIMGYGAQLIRGESSKEHGWRMFAPANNLTLLGLTLHPFVDQAAPWTSGNVIYGDDDWLDTVLVDCTIKGGKLGSWRQDGLLVDHCRFDRASTGTISGAAMFHANRWVGHCAITHAFLAYQGNRLAVLDATFDGTDRGIVLRSTWGPIKDCLFDGIDFRSINRVGNGNELITTEGGGTGVEGCCFFNVRANGCMGDMNAWDAPFRNNLCRDWYLDGSSVLLSGHYDQSGNEFHDLELQGGKIELGLPNAAKGYPGALRNKFVQCAVVGTRPTRTNQMDGDPKRYQVEEQAAISGDASNVFERCSVTGSPAGMRDPVRGVSWRA